ncbi:MAG TPA: hypothetical protein VMZ71_09130 [Gemmataceae bacterium]|nr:hypothetical protein [Gemmataceae bacterium]
MRNLVLAALAACCLAASGSADMPGQAATPVVVPAGNYHVGISPHDGSDPNAPEGFPFGEALIYPSFENGRWGYRAHGYVQVPTPSAGEQAWWTVVAREPAETTRPESPTQFAGGQGFVTQWNGPGVFHWTAFVEGGWGDPVNPNLPPGVFECPFAMMVRAAGTGGQWATVAYTVGYFGW